MVPPAAAEADCPTEELTVGSCVVLLVVNVYSPTLEVYTAMKLFVHVFSGYQICKTHLLDNFRC